MSNSTGASKTRIIFGIILVLLGLLFILDNYDIFDFRFPVEWLRWQNILIAIGVILLLSSKNKGAGVLLIVIGFIGHYPDLWPLILIGIGIYIMLNNRNPKAPGSSSHSGKDIANEDYLDEVNILGGSEKIINSSNFRGGKITSIMGGSEIDLRNCRLAEGENVIDVFVLFGGMSIKAPNNWVVKNDITSILGGFSDERSLPKDETKDETRSLKLKGLILFGGGEIK